MWKNLLSNSSSKSIKTPAATNEQQAKASSTAAVESTADNYNEDDSYWGQQEEPATTASTSTAYLKRFADKSSLWDGLFSPADGPSNLFDLTDDFKRQSISESITANGDSSTSEQNNNQEGVEELEAIASTNQGCGWNWHPKGGTQSAHSHLRLTLQLNLRILKEQKLKTPK